jgi:acetyl-CoA C-acetyltransferase
MPYVASIGTYLPCWGTPHVRMAGDDDDAITLAMAGGVDRVPARQVGMSGVGNGLDSTMHPPKPHLSHVDVEEVHDFFTGTELISYEDHGFAERFGGYKLVEADVTTIGGGVRVQPSGVELFTQLRGEAVKQVHGARIGLAHKFGRPAAVSAVTSLEGAVHVAR